MKFKYFLRGVGIGMIITAILLGISYKSKMSDEEVISKAKKLGMVFEDVPEASVSPIVSDAPEETVVPAETTEPEVTDVPETTGAPEVTAAPKKPSKKVTLVINKGDSSRKVSERLESLGVVKDYADFDQYLIDNGYAVKLVVGTFSIATDASYETIAKTITK